MTWENALIWRLTIVASEDAFLRLDPYNFNTEEEQEGFLKDVEFVSNDDNKPNSLRGSGSNQRGLGGQP